MGSDGRSANHGDIEHVECLGFDDSKKTMEKNCIEDFYGGLSFEDLSLEDDEDEMQRPRVRSSGSRLKWPASRRTHYVYGHTTSDGETLDSRVFLPHLGGAHGGLHMWCKHTGLPRSHN